MKKISLDFEINEDEFATWCGHINRSVDFEDKDTIRAFVHNQFVKNYIVCTKNDLKFKLYNHISLAIDRLSDLEKAEEANDDIKTYAKNLRVELLASRFYLMHHFNIEEIK